MVKLDFWNNPLVVSAMRQRYRRGSPGLTASAYLLLLICIGAMLHYTQDEMELPWIRMYLVVIIGIQFVVSGLFAVLSTSVSMQAEVNNRTLDFQRIAALSPRQILLGKILGEPSSGYLLAIATVPLVVLCCLWGGASLDVAGLLYINLATTTLMLASLGIVRKLEPSEIKPGWGGQNQSSGASVAIMIMFIVPWTLMGAGNFAVANSQNPLATIVGCFTPILSIYGLAMDDPWGAGFTFWGVKHSYLYVTPYAQLALAALCFEGMARKLKRPLDPLLSKPSAYGLLIVIDVVAAGLLFGNTPVDGLGVMSAEFCLVHLVAGLILIMIVTPRRTVYETWIWRFRGRGAWLRDSLLDDRSENVAVLATVAAIGAINLPLLVWLPSELLNQAGPTPVAMSTVVTMMLCTGLLIVSLGVLYQWFMLVGDRNGSIAFFLFVGAVVVLPALVGYYFAEIAPEMTGEDFTREAALFRSMTPVSHFSAWARFPDNALSVAPMAGIYGLLLVVSWILLRRRVDQQRRVVDSKLESMQVVETSERGQDLAAR